ncbi:MAG: elongation factor G [Candidatus Riflebacteria bacterium]|nr:elongation factor G [Candidatus Riflebacteria bacterium]
MAKYSPEQIRAFAVVGHGSTGKTTLVESFLFNAGVITRMGRVEDGSTRTDYDAEETKRQVSINSIPATFAWASTELDVVDCPGFVDFLPEVRAVLNAMDAAVVCVSAQAGCEAGTEKCFEYVHEYKLPALVYIGKMDKENADFDKAVKSLGDIIGGHFVPFIVPIGSAETFQGVVDVLASRAYIYTGDTGTFEERAVPENLAAKVASCHEKIVEAAAETDDALTEKYLNGDALSPEELSKGIRAAILTGKLIPVACGSSTKSIGVKQVLNVIAAQLPSPLDRTVTAIDPNTKNEIQVKPAADGDLLVQVFKVLQEQHVGEVVIVRVWNGTLTPGSLVYNSTRGEKEKVGQILKVVGKDRSDTESLVAGQVGALVKLRVTKMGESLSSEKQPMMRAKVEFPDPTISYAVKPASQADQEKLANVLTGLGAQDPCFRAYMDPTTKEIIFAAMGDVQLEIFISRLKQKANVTLETAKPRIPYQETIRGTAEAEGKVKKQTGGRGQFAVVNLRLEPLPSGKGFEFVDAIVGGVVPRNFIPAVEKGLLETLPRGVIAGYPMTDVRVTLFFGKYHDVDSSEQAFKTAASVGFKEAVRNARPVLLEPIMNVLITVPEENMGDIIGDLNSRRGKIQGMDPLGKKTRVKALVPLAEMYRYVTNLRSMTGGRGEFVMVHDHYEEVPAHLASSIIAEFSKEKSAEE